MNQEDTTEVNHTEEEVDAAFDIGWAAEQAMADAICSSMEGKEPVAAAFDGAFLGLVARLLRFCTREELVEMIDNQADEVDHDHICNDCREDMQ